MKSFPFNAEPIVNSEGIIIGFDRAMTADDQRNWDKVKYSRGVDLRNPDAFSFRAGTGMTVIMTGTTSEEKQAWAFVKGVRCWEELAEREFAVEAAHASLDRIDRAVLRVDDTQSQRKADIYILKGVPASIPIAPELTRNATIEEIGLVDIFVPKSSTATANSRLTDLRLNEELCGTFESAFNTPDTQPYFNQIQALIDELKEIIIEVAGGGIADGAVTTPKLADGAVTTAKVSSDTTVPNSNKLGNQLPSYYATAAATTAAQNTANAATSSAATAQGTANSAAATANAAMPKAGGDFTGAIRAPLNSTSIYAQMYNSLLTNSDGSTNGAAGYFKFQLK